MFQLWKLVLLCGLLTGTSASLFSELGNDLQNVIDEGHEFIKDTVQTVAGNLKKDLTRLQNINLGQMTNQLLRKADDLLADAIGKVLSVSKNILGLKITNIHVKNIKPGLTSDGEGLDLSLPIKADVELNLPLIGQTVDLKLSMNILSGVKIESEDGKSKVVMTKCNSDPASISLSLLNKRSQLANSLVRAASSFLSETLSNLVETQVCPLVRLFLNTLGVDFVQDAINGLKQHPSA